ncbi:hypothetical protein BT69DRAFT_516151 [Atractiella rhizophila]|nr:hypothetical protein BT69DRAFT_516151 [Atractiella rhizophila]
MSCLLRLATIKDGAEKLIESRIFECLVNCEFLSARPPSDPSGMVVDNFVPPVIERHHQLLLPALQLVTSILFSYPNAPPHRIRSLAWTFVQSQREILLTTLRDAHRARGGYTILREARLVVFLLRTCWAVIPEDELTLPSKYGAIHNAVLNLAAKVLADEHWINGVEPSTEDEKYDSQTAFKCEYI